MVALVMTSLHATGRTTRHDTVYYYKTWHQIFKLTPKAVIIEPVINVHSPYMLEFLSGDEELNKALVSDYMAVSEDLSTWYINSEYIKKNFTGDTQGLKGYIPLYYNDKIAFAVNGYIAYWSTSAFDIVYNDAEDDGIPYYDHDIYYLDFAKRKVVKVTPTTLSGMLEEYHDLQMRYEGMRDYKSPRFVEDFFFKYIDRVTQDPMHPRILDMLDNDTAPIN